MTRSFSLLAMSKHFPLLLLNIVLCAAQNKDSHMFAGRSGIVHLFEWTFNDIANECQFLGERGYGGVQTSPITESKIGANNDWTLRYHPVSYKIVSRSGNVDEFKNMIKSCLDQKIRVYVDVVLNHMAAGDDEIMGLDHSTADPPKLQYPAVPYQASDFNEFCFVENATNAFEVRNCRLAGLPDLKQEQPTVQEKIVAFLNELIDLGVAGFRIDAVS